MSELSNRDLCPGFQTSKTVKLTSLPPPFPNNLRYTVIGAPRSGYSQLLISVNRVQETIKDSIHLIFQKLEMLLIEILERHIAFHIPNITNTMVMFHFS